MNPIYETPEIEIINVVVEKGFSASLEYSDEFADDRFGID